MTALTKKKLLLGAHVSASGGAYNAPYNGAEIGCSTIQIFTSNQRQWKGKQITTEEIDLWFEALEKTGIEEVMSHASYLINLGTQDKLLLEKGRNAFLEEINRCQLFKIPYLNFHPGSATTGTEDECLDQIVESLLGFDKVLETGETRLLLEATAGQGKTMGHRFEHLAYIIERTEKKIPIGVCIDTCHIFSAGYDIRTRSSWEAVLREFDEIVGLDNLYAFHINDSMKELGSRRDRHAPIGQGLIGLECFEFLVTSPKTRHLPMYLETPNKELYQDELNLLRKCADETNKD